MKSTLSFLVNYLKKEDIDIDFDEFILQAETHPDFPTLYAFSDTLSFFNVNNLAALVNKENLGDLPDRFIAHLQPEGKAPFFSFVEKQKGLYRYSEDNKENFVSSDGFLKIWQGVILVVEKTEDVISSAHKSEPTVLSLSILGIFIAASMIWYAQPSFASIALTVFSFAGLYLCFEVLKKVFGVTSTFASAVCGSGATVKSGCDAIIHSKKSTLFSKLAFSDLSVFFFFGHFISFYLMVLPGYFQYFLNYSLLTLTLGIPLILYSLYYQWRIEKQWCTICLLIIGVFCLELAIFFGYGSFSTIVFSISPLLLFTTGFVVSVSGWLLVKPKINAYFDHKSNDLSLKRFKRNYTMFKLALKDTEQISYEELESEIYLGNPDAKLKISLVTNLFCGHCVGMHSDLKEILKRYGNDIRVNIRFNLRLNGIIEKSELMYFKLFEIYKQQGQNVFFTALDVWFNHKDTEAWINQFGTGTEDEETKAFFKLQYQQNAANKLLFTPALLVGEFLYPKVYNRSDLIYFISELAEDDLSINQQLNLLPANQF